MVMILLELMLTDWNCSERLVTVIIPVAVSVCDSFRLHELGGTDPSGWYGCPSLVIVVCCQLEVSVTC